MFLLSLVDLKCLRKNKQKEENSSKTVCNLLKARYVMFSLSAKMMFTIHVGVVVRDSYKTETRYILHTLCRTVPLDDAG